MRVLLVSLLLLLPLAAAQSPDAPTPDADNLTLWLHAQSSTGPQWMNTVEADGDSNYRTGNWVPDMAGKYSVSFKLAAPSETALVFDTSQDIVFDLHWGAGWAARATPSVELKAGDITIASAQGSADTAVTSYDKWVHEPLKAKPSVSELPAGTILDYIVTFDAQGGTLIGTGHGYPHNSITLPLLNRAAPVSEGLVELLNFTGDALNLTWNGTLIERNINITGAGDLGLTYALNGTLNATYVDAQNNTWNETLTGEGVLMRAVSNGTLQLVGDANGTVLLAFKAPESAIDDPNPTTGNVTEEPLQNATVPADNKESPGPLVPAMVGIIGLMGWLRRRN